MAILKKTLFDEKLETYRVFLEDTEPNSEYFKITELGDVFTGGKNSFLIQGSEQLDADSVVKIQIRDSQGNIIYHEPGEGIPEYYEGTSKVVSVYIYPDTTFGPCTITILGELKEYNSNGLNVPVPENWKGVYNVRWQKQINVNPLLQNTTKIRFYRRPKVDVQEVIFPIYSIDFNRKTISGSVTGTAINPIEGDDFKFFKGDTIYELKSNVSTFSSSMEGETITINGLISGYAPVIKEVVSSTKAFATIPYYETSSTDPNAYQNVLGFSSSPFTLSFDESSVLINSFVSSSFAKITLTDLETFSGDVNRVKVYATRLADIGNFTLLEDIKLESNEILSADSFNGNINVRTGLFNNQSLIDSFWIYRGYDSATTYTKLIDSDLLIGSVKLLDLNSENTSTTPQKLFYYSSSIDFTKNTEYQLNFNLLLSSSAYTPNKILIYGSGSSFVNTDDTLPLGKLIGEISTNKTFTRFDRQEFNFKPDSDGTGTIVFAVHQGNWQVGNIGLRASQETNFSPNEVSLTVAMPTVVNDDTYDFKFEFYDINNNYVPVLVEKLYTFVGGTGAAAQKSLSLASDINIFSFSGSGAPIGATSTTISVEKTNLTGSVTFYSAAFDINGNYLSPSLYAGGQYPGLLTNINETSTLTTAILTAAAFTGSLTSEKVTRVVYTASCEGLSDKLNIYRIEAGGAGTNGSNAIQYVIRPLTGTALKNNSGSLELQLSKIDGTSLIDLASGNVKLVTGSANLAITAGGGITAGVNGIPYNARFDSTKISGSLIVKAYDFDTNNVVDAITLVDVTDGIPAGVINSSNGLTFVRQTNNGFFFSPETSKVTASFYSATGVEVSESIAITASYSAGSDFFKYDVLVDNPNVGLIVRAADGTTLTAGVAKATRTISTQFTYSSLRVSETFNIMADGASGSNGTNGAAAKTANLNSPFYVISYDKDGLNPTPSTLFPITASAINFTSPYFKFTGDVNSPEGTYTVGSSSTEDTASFTAPSSYFTTPKSFRVGIAEATAPTVEVAYDTITIAAVKVGQSGTDGLSSQFYFIRPLSGSQIRNSQGTLELQGVWVSGSTSFDLKSGSVVLTTGSVSTALLRSGSGVTSGSNAVQFNAKFDATAISGSRVVYLYDTGSNKLYDTITLVDTTDGIAGGSVIADTLIFRRDPNNNSFTPTTASVTASFFGTNGTEYQERYRIYPYYESLLDKMYFTLDSDNAQITASIDDGSGTRIASGFANRITTKDLNFRFTFVDPQTSDSASAVETFYIISDGQDGDDAYTVILTNDSHTLPTTNTDIVTYTNSGTNILVYKGTTQLQATLTANPGTGFYSASVSASSNITPGTLSVVGLGEVVADHSSMTSNQASILYKINCEGTQSVVKLQTLSKANQGAASKTVNLTSPYYVIAYDKDGITPSPSALFPITASAINFVSPYFRFTGDVNSPEATYTAGSSSSEDSSSFTPPTSYFTTPKTFRVGVAEASAPTVELAYDTITIAAIKVGATGDTGASTQFYFIRPLSGSQLKNSQGTLELQAVWISGSTTYDLKSGSIVLTSASVATATLRSGSGILSGSNAVQFNAKFDANAISGSRTIYLYDTGSNRLYDTITLVDTTDGVAAGSVIADTLIFRRDPNNNLFTPATASVTASFFGTNGTEYQERYRVYPFYETLLDKMYFTLDSDNANITASIDDGGGTRIASGFSNRITTKDLNFRFTFVDPQTADSSSAIETLYIISDGQDGDDAYTVILTNDSHTLPTTNTGTVTYTNSGTNISVYKGTTQLQATLTANPGTGFYSASVSASSNITPGTLSVVGLNQVVADHSSITANVASILYKVSCEGTQSVVKLQTLSKANQGNDGATAKTVNLNSPNYIISYDKDGANPSPSALFPITASAINFTSPYFRFTGDVNSPEGTYTVGSSSTEDTASFTPPSTYFTTPRSFRVGVAEASAPTVELAYDTITVAAVRVGSTGDTGASTQMYFIRPLSGSQLRNSQGSLELQAVWISGSTSFDIKSGSILLTTASVATALLRSGSGVTSGSNAVQFNAKFDATAISGSRVIYLYDTGSNRLYDTITLVDTTDGVSGGSVISPSLFTRREPLAGGLYQYNPTTLPLTASFIGTSGIQYNTRITLYPSYSVARTIDSMYYTLDASTASISFVADDGSGNLYAGAGASNYKDTKDVTFRFTFTDPQTNDTSTTLETFYIISDGIDGDDAYTVVLTNDAHTAPTTNTGTVTYTNSGTSIIAYRGSTELNGVVSGTPIAGQFSASVVASNITAGTITSTGNPIVVGDHSAMTADLATVTYTINLEGTSSVTKVQTISKAKQGSDGQMNLAYVITPVSGTILKNKTGTLELRITRLSGSAVNEISGGAVVLVTGSANTPISVGGGVTAGPNGILWNGIFDTTKISGSLVVRVRDTGSNITYDTITLADITDGLTAGTINATNGLILTRNPNNNNVYTPTTTGFTGSFYDVRGNLYTSSLLITANFSTVDQLKYTINQTNANMTLAVRDSAGNVMTNDTYANTTGINVRYVFTDPFSGDIVDCIETARIASDGSNGIAFIVSNENTSLPAQSTGWVASGSFLTTSGSINVKVGTEDILFASPISNNRFSASISQSTNVGNTAVLTNNNYSIGVLTQDSGSLLLKIVYQDAKGSQVSGSRVVTYSKSKAGVPNVLVAVSPSAQSINSNSRGSGSLSPTTLTITAVEGGTSRFTSIGTPTYTNGLAGSVSTNTIVFSSTATSMTADTGNVTIPVNFTDSEGTPGSRNIIATVSRTRTAAPTVLAIFSKESQSITKTNTGTYAAPTTFTISVNEGGSNYTYDAALSANNTYYVSSITGGSNSSGTITPTTPTTDAGTTVSITISYRNSEATTGTITKEHRVNVTIDGSTGSTGADGRRTATGMVHYQIAASSAPSTPSATSYTFSTNAFTSLTANWGFGAPTYASGNSNKYWYSTYTAVETTAGGGTATPTFGSPVQAIGFSGLVTFTSANNITDGTNFSNIVPSGSITNHIGGANVTTIEGGKVSTGVITSTGYTLPGGDTLATGTYTTAGTIFNLNNGSLRSQNFYIDSSGNAFFRGNLAAASITTGLGYTPPTPTQVTSSISAIKVGGTNLLLNSKPIVYNQIVGVVANSSTITVDSTNLWKGQPTLRVVGTGGVRWLSNPVIEPYTEYIASMMVKADSSFVGSQDYPLHPQLPANSHAHEVLGTYDQTVGTDWKQIWLRFSSNQSTNTTFQLYLYNIGTTPFNVAWVKLEKGNKQTDWSAAPEDVASGSIGNVDILGSGVLNYNPDFSISTVDGKPAGALASFGSSDNNVVSFLDSNKNSIKLSDTVDSEIGLTMPAIRLNKDAQYNITFRIKSNTTTSSGFYFRMQEIDAELPQGYTNVSGYAGATGVYTTSVRDVYSGAGLTIVAGTATEDGPMTTSYVTYQVTYKPTSTAKWASPLFLKWGTVATSVELHIDRLTIQQDTSIKTQGSVGGWTIDSDSIFTGTKDTSGYSTTGITLYGGGSIHAPQFYIDTAGNAFFNGSITAGSITTGLGYTPPTTTDVNNASKTAGSVGGWTINSSQIYAGSAGSDGAFNAGAGITLGGSGYISSKNFYIDSSGNAKFKGNISFGAAGSGINMAPINIKYNPYSSGWAGVSGSSYDNLSSLNGYVTESAFNYMTDPFGKTTLGWECYPDGYGQADGGWNTSRFAIDNNKTYKFVLYVRRHTSLTGNDAGGYTYWGMYGLDSGAGNVGVKYVGTNSIEGNPYFWYGNLPVLNRWYLIVGYVHQQNYPTTTNIGRIYDCETGAEVTPTVGQNYVQDFMWRPENFGALHRAYLFYNLEGNGITKYQDLWGAAVYEVDGTEPDLNELLDKGKMIANGNFSGGTFINSTTVYSPIIAGTNGYFSGVVKVGSAGITLDGVNKKIFVGAGNYANSDTAFYVDNASNFSLGDKLYWNGTSLTISGTIDATGGSFTGDVDAGGVKIGPSGILLNSGSFNQIALNNTGIAMSSGTSLQIDGGIILSSLGGFVTSLQTYSMFTSRLRLYSNSTSEGGHNHSLTFDSINSGTGTTMVIDGSGYVKKSSSSARYKKNIKELPLEDAKKIFDLNVITFNDLHDADLNEHTGFIAEDVHNLGLNDWVIYDKSGSVDGVWYQSIFSSMVKVVQDLNKRVEQLEAIISGSI